MDPNRQVCDSQKEPNTAMQGHPVLLMPKIRMHSWNYSQITTRAELQVKKTPQTKYKDVVSDLA